MKFIPFSQYTIFLLLTSIIGRDISANMQKRPLSSRADLSKTAIVVRIIIPSLIVLKNKIGNNKKCKKKFLFIPYGKNSASAYNSYYIIIPLQV